MVHLEARRRSVAVERWLVLTCEDRERIVCHSIATQESEGTAATAVRRCRFCQQAVRRLVQNLHPRPPKFRRLEARARDRIDWAGTVRGENLPLFLLPVAERRLLGRAGLNQGRRRSNRHADHSHQSAGSETRDEHTEAGQGPRQAQLSDHGGPGQRGDRRPQDDGIARHAAWLDSNSRAMYLHRPHP
jgi:hypothetical protein